MIKILKSSCDDSMFMGADIILTLNTSDNLHGIGMEFEVQAGYPLYLRKYEIKDLIDNLQILHDLIEEK